MRKRRRSYSHPRHSADAIPPVIRLWLLRTLVPLGGFRGFVTRHGWEDDNLAKCLGLDVDDAFNGDDSPSPEQSIALLKSMHAEAEADCPTTVEEGGLQQELISNANTLGDRFGYTQVEKDILIFCVLLHALNELHHATNYLGNLTTPRVISVLACILGYSEKQVAEALGASSHLMASGLISLSGQFSDDLFSRIDLLSNNFGARMLTTADNPMQLIRDMVSPGLPLPWNYQTTAILKRTSPCCGRIWPSR